MVDTYWNQPGFRRTVCAICYLVFCPGALWDRGWYSPLFHQHLDRPGDREFQPGHSFTQSSGSIAEQLRGWLMFIKSWLILLNTDDSARPPPSIDSTAQVNFITIIKTCPPILNPMHQREQIINYDSDSKLKMRYQSIAFNSDSFFRETGILMPISTIATKCLRDSVERPITFCKFTI